MPKFSYEKSFMVGLNWVCMITELNGNQDLHVDESKICTYFDAGKEAIRTNLKLPQVNNSDDIHRKLLKK